MSCEEPTNKKSLVDLGYSKEQVEVLRDLANSANHQVFGGVIASLPAKNPLPNAKTPTDK